MTPALAAMYLTAAMFGSPPRPGKIILYDGFGTPTALEISGRLIEDKALAAPDKKRSRLANLVDNVRTLETDEIPGAVLKLEVAHQKQRVTTDHDGCFAATFALPKPIVTTTGTTAILARVIEDRGHATPQASGLVHVVADAPAIGVISDFDDTVVQTEVVDRKRLMKNTFAKNAAQVAIVEGVERAYPAAQKAGARVFFYLTGSPHSFHERISDVLARHKLPRGPILLKNFGQDALMEQQEYKLSRIRKIMDAFPKLRFVLIGDTGEKDPEIYRQIAKERPDRVAAIVIRRAPGGLLDKLRLEGMTLFDDYKDDANVVARLIERSLRKAD